MKSNIKKIIFIFSLMTLALMTFGPAVDLFN